ncbi:MAG: hypothetical protein KatS3mg076_0461 [Candidatus Binatia bacterium]|nr:MAG: hypothetical protein KatS3mg076_0461 [Candidatus Binatia bacterium]
MATVATRPREETTLPLLAVGLGLVVAGLQWTLGIELSAVLVVGLAGLALVLSRPELGVLFLLSSFLYTYPPWLVNAGPVSLNNALGGLLALVLFYRSARTGDWSYLKRPEVLLLGAITGIGLFSRFLNPFDELTRSLVGELERRGQDPADILFGRFAFFVLFVAFVRDRRYAYAAFVLAIVLFVASGLAGIVRVLGGEGFAGYRANWGLFVAAAGNPNRLALFCIIAILALRYLWQSRPGFPTGVSALVLTPLLVLAVFMTASRSGVAGLALAGLLLFFEGGVSVKKLLAGATVVVLAFPLVANLVPERSLERLSVLPGTGREADPLGGGSIERRGYGLQVALDLAERNPLIGVGVGNWEVVRYLRDPARYVAPPHSSYLAALAEGGILSLVLYLVLFARTLRNYNEAERAVEARAVRDAWLFLWTVRTLRTGFVVFLAFSLVGDLWRVIIFHWFIGLSVVLQRSVCEEGGARR